MDKLDKFHQFFDFLKQDNGYILQAFIVILVALIADMIQRRVFKGLRSRAGKTNTIWDDILVESIVRPLSFIIWAAGIYMATKIIQEATGAVIFDAVEPVRDSVVVGALGWFLVRVINHGEQSFLNAADADRATIDAVSKLLRISVVITTILVALQTLGFSVSGVLAFGGIGGIAIGFAAKDLLANFFGGLMIYLDRPFIIGDWVRSPDREIEGTVESIGWRLTCIRTFDKRPLYVPNSVFANVCVENPSRMTNRRIKETIGIRYDDALKMEPVIRRVKKMLLEHPDIDQSKTLIVNFNAFNSSSLDFFIYTFTKTTDWIQFHEVKQDVLFQIVNIITDEGAEFAFPTSTIHVADSVAVENLEARELRQ